MSKQQVIYTSLVTLIGFIVVGILAYFWHLEQLQSQVETGVMVGEEVEYDFKPLPWFDGNLNRPNYNLTIPKPYLNATSEFSEEYLQRESVEVFFGKSKGDFIWIREVHKLEVGGDNNSTEQAIEQLLNPQSASQGYQFEEVIIGDNTFGKKEYGWCSAPDCTKTEGKLFSYGIAVNENKYLLVGNSSSLGEKEFEDVILSTLTLKNS